MGNTGKFFETLGKIVFNLGIHGICTVLGKYLRGETLALDFFSLPTEYTGRQWKYRMYPNFFIEPVLKDLVGYSVGYVKKQAIKKGLDFRLNP